MTKTYPYRGQQLTVTQLADLAGCGRSCMGSRLRVADAETAVARGASDRLRQVKPVDKRREIRVAYDYRGEMLGVGQLASMAGCTYAAMKSRLSNMSAEVAVGMGASNCARRERVVKHDLNGRMLSVAELAKMVRCSPGTMRSRLKYMTAEKAVAMGGSTMNRSRPASGNRNPGARPKMSKPGGSSELNKQSWAHRERKARDKAEKAKPQGEAIITKRTTITVAPKHQDRGYIDPASVPPLFSCRRYGHYMADEDSATARRFGGAA